LDFCTQFCDIGQILRPPSDERAQRLAAKLRLSRATRNISQELAHIEAGLRSGRQSPGADQLAPIEKLPG